jgi:hypothetical protein
MEPKPEPEIDWSLTTWEGSRREQVRQWRELSWDQILAAQEEMAEIAEMMNGAVKRLPEA